MLPGIIQKLSKIPDPRRTKSIKHKLTVLMIYGLLIFLFRVESRRHANEIMPRPALYESLKSLFPQLESIPHADTLARLLETIEPEEIEKVHVEMINKLIRKKKFKSLLIQGYYPISLDGTQKFTRYGFLHDEHLPQRTLHKKSGDIIQQYGYVLEANMTLPNGLSIPLVSEYVALDPEKTYDKQDCELIAFPRIVKRIKKYFPRLKFILILDKLFADRNVCKLIQKYRWQYMIKLPTNKFKNITKLLNDKGIKESIPNQQYYRKRKQKFSWVNNIIFSKVKKNNVVGCTEHWQRVNSSTQNIENVRSEHIWISSLPLNINNVHVLCNLGARNRALIEDNMNTEKNRGYSYKHVFSYNWNGMRCFHNLMRMGHAINAISEFTKKLKKYINERGVNTVLSYIFETLSNKWLTSDWFDKNIPTKPQIKFAIE